MLFCHMYGMHVPCVSNEDKSDLAKFNGTIEKHMEQCLFFSYCRKEKEPQ
jgi:hypothetical protein